MIDSYQAYLADFGAEVTKGHGICWQSADGGHTGAYCAAEEARISIWDGGFNRGILVFDVIPMWQGWIYRGWQARCFDVGSVDNPSGFVKVTAQIWQDSSQSPGRCPFLDKPGRGPYFILMFRVSFPWDLVRLDFAQHTYR